MTILLTSIKECGKIFEYTPLQIKQSLVGYGRAEKHQVQIMVRDTLKLEAVPKPDDTADALAAIFMLVRDINTAIANGAKKASLEAMADIFDQLTDVLGLVYNRKNDSLDSEIEELIEKRQAARKARDFKTADASAPFANAYIYSMFTPPTINSCIALLSEPVA